MFGGDAHPHGENRKLVAHLSPSAMPFSPSSPADIDVTNWQAVRSAVVNRKALDRNWTWVQPPPKAA
jgi:hypothetical protein